MLALLFSDICRGGLASVHSILSYIERRGHCCLYCKQGSPEPQWEYNQQFPRFLNIVSPPEGTGGLKIKLAYEAGVILKPYIFLWEIAANPPEPIHFKSI